MYAIIVDGGRQYKVEQGRYVDIDYRESLQDGDSISFDRVLAVGGEAGLKLGTPTLAGATVTGKVLSLQKGPKIFIQKFLRRKNYDRRTGHRQKYTRVSIESINA
jgi:large subunit ribosomal protein L21